MPKVRNTSGVQPGSIYRIKLGNFVTYKQVELFPGRGLNMIIGPNGTGKSTFVCAIVLGLCGKIASIGRSKKISHYIQHGCDKAIIEIELYMEHNKDNVTITREFNLKEVSRWYIDNKLVSQSAVATLISSLNIQVDNLCQLLPQDRVKDFAAMDQHTLLQSTLAAVGKEQEVAQLQELKKWRTDHRSLAETLKKTEERRQDLITQNERLKLRIEAIQQKKELEKQIKVCDCKLLWIEANYLKEKCKEYQTSKKAAEKQLKVHRDKMKPLEESMKNVKTVIEQLEQHRLDLNNDIITLKMRATDQLQEVKFQNDQIKDAQSWYNEIKKKLQTQKAELEEAKLLLATYKEKKIKVLETYGDESNIKRELNSLIVPMSKLREEKFKISRHIADSQNTFENQIFPEMQCCRNQIQTLQNVDRRRLQFLESVSPDASQALNWLKNNMNLFEGPVLGPMMLEINFPEQKYARYLESTVARRDLLAFTFASGSDMSLFLTKVRQEKGWKQVNAVCSPQDGEPLPESPDIRDISRYGFKTYLVDTFTAPDVIVKYLCRNYNIHNIPIGDDYVYNNSGNVPQNIRLFFSENHRFAVRVSAYSGAKSSSISEIQAPRLLTDTVNVDKIREWQQMLASFEEKEKQYREEKQRLDKRLAAIEAEYHKLEEKKNAINNDLAQVQSLSRKIHSQERTVHQKENAENIDLQQAKEQCSKREKDCVIKQVNLHDDLVKEVLRPLHLKVASKKLAMLKLQKTRDTIVDKETKLREIKKNLDQAKCELDKLLQLEERAKQKADEKLTEARRASNNKEPNDPSFPYRDTYATLPHELQALRTHRDELHAKASCMGHSDEADLKAYQENLKQINKLSTDEESAKVKNQQLEKTMKKIKLAWLKTLKELLHEISAQFSEMFAMLGCAGEVRLKQGACEDDFADYGVSIMVQFRANEELSELTQHTQSGGERALSTALYLLALQRLAAAPFRCVDEINQGMDSTNERKMYELMVRVTTEGQHSQYFLLTPKLLTDLTYNKKITVHTVMNGSEIMSFDEWQMQSFLERGPAYR